MKENEREGKGRKGKGRNNANPVSLQFCPAIYYTALD
jgi:hypothetical protein